MNFIKKAVRKALNDKQMKYLRTIRKKIMVTYSYIGHRRNYSQKRKHETLNMVFLVTLPQSWNSLKTVYRAAVKKANINVYVVVVPYTTVRSDGSLLESFDYFKEECPGAINAIQGNKLFDIKSLQPDVIFRQTPYDISYPKKYMYSKLSRYAKVCYVPYNYNFSPKKHLEIEYNEIALSNIYAIFSESESNKSYCLMMKEKCRWYRDLHIFYLGFPRFELYSNNFKSDNKDNNREKYVFTWIPRWSTDSYANDATSFFDYSEKLLAYFQSHRECLLVIRPHPLMFSNFIKVGMMTQKEVTDFRKKILQEVNISLDDNLDYLKTFSESDALIADMSSINVEFFITGKPIIYCGNTKECNNETAEMMQLCYKASCWKELEKYIEELSNGIDPNKEKRKQVAEKFLENTPKNVGEAIVNKCLEII